MKAIYKRVFLASFVVTSTIIVLPQLLLVPFGFLIGLLTGEEVSFIMKQPTILLALLVLMGLIALSSYLIVKKTAGREKLNMDDIKKLGYKVYGLFFFFVIVELVLVAYMINIRVSSTYPNATLYAVLISLSFILLTCFPFQPIITQSIENLIRSELPDEDSLYFPFNQKLLSLIAVNFIGTVLMFICLHIVTTLSSGLGRSLPLGNNIPFIMAGVLSLLILMMAFKIINVILVVPINSLSRSFQTAASGDFTEAIGTKTADEIGRMSIHANRLTEKLNQSFSSINSAAGRIETSKDALGADVEEISGAIVEINQNLESTDAQMQDHSANVAETTAVVEQLARNIDALGTHIFAQSEMVSHSDKAVTNLLDANDQLDTLTATGRQKIDSLVEASGDGGEKIKSMVNRINDIMESSQHLIEANSLIASVASQTNLLAMNAAIEAAHAGEAGRGFAVVADEIRKLAETSSSQSKNINQNLKEVLEHIGSVGTETKSVQNSFGQIEEHVQDVREAVDSINEFSIEVRRVSGEIRKALSEISEVSEGISTGSQEMQQGNSEILQAVVNMRDISQRVVESVSEITIGSKEIMQLSVNMLEQNRNTDDEIRLLHELISGYKLKETEAVTLTEEL